MTRSYTLGNWDGSLSASDATKQRPTSGEMNLSDSVIVHFASSQNSPLQSVPATCGDKEESSTVFHMGDSEKKGEPEELKSINMQEKPSIRNDLLSDQGGANELTDIPDGVQKKSFEKVPIEPLLARVSVLGQASVSNDPAEAPIENAAAVSPVAFYAFTGQATHTIHFLPALESALHSPSVTRTRPVLQALSKPPIPSASAPLPVEDMGRVETMSLYSIDADGEDEEDDILVEELLSYSPMKEEISRNQSNDTNGCLEHDSLFTPPLSDHEPLNEPPIPVQFLTERLFTPEASVSPPLPSFRKKTRSRIILSPPLQPRALIPYISIPPLQKPKSDYVRLSRLIKHTKPVDGHASVRDALEAAWQHNSRIGTHEGDEGKPKKRRVKRRREDEMGPIAGPSRLESISTATGKTILKRHQPQEEPMSDSKQPRVIDLTQSDDDFSHRRQFPATRKIVNNIVVKSVLSIELAQPISSRALAFNTRFIRGAQLDRHLATHIDVERKPIQRRTCLVDQSNLEANSQDVYSIGVSTSDKDFRQPAEDDSDDDIVIVDVGHSPRVQMGPPSPGPALARPRPPGITLVQPAPKIDLAAKFRKRKVAKKGRVHHTQDTIASVDATSSHYSPIIVQAVPPSALREDITPSFPSAKALGKRRAVSPTPTFSASSYQHYTTSRPHAFRISASARHEDIFFHTPGPSPTSTRLTTSFDPYIRPVSPTLADPRRISPSNDSFGERLAGSSSTSFHQSNELAGSQAGFYSELPGDLFSESGYLDPWSLVDHDEPQYVFDTINPALLGGNPLPIIPSRATGEGQQDNSEAATSRLTSSPSPSSSSLSFSNTSSPSSSRLSNYSDVVGQSSSHTTAETENVKPSNYSRLSSKVGEDLPRRRHVQRRLPDMVPIEDVFSATNSEYQASSRSSSPARSLDGSVIVSRPRIPIDQQAVRVQRRLPKPLAEVDRRNENWPKSTSESYCHQCRRKSFVRKLSCGMCSKQYCMRCLAHRYPDKPQVSNMGQKGGPCCLGYCNCTICCQKRGIDYVSARQPITARPDTSNTLTTNASSPSPAAGAYWGTIYGLDGVKLGSTFAQKARNKRDARKVMYVPVNTLGVRWFAGAVQPCWKLGRRPAITEVDPVRQPQVPKGREPRQFVGRSSPLFYRTEAMAALTPVSSMNEDSEDEIIDISAEDGGVVGERSLTQPQNLYPDSRVGETFSPDSLREEDVKQAIVLALTACGVNVVD